MDRILLAFTCLALSAAAQQVPFVQVIGPGAPKGASFLMEDTIRGGLWMGGVEVGGEGLVYFDGSRFISPVKDFPKLLISGMAEDGGGGIWIACNAGLYHFTDGKLEKTVGGTALTGIARVAPDTFLAAMVVPGRVNENQVDVLRIMRLHNTWRTDTVLTAVPPVRFRADDAGNVLYPCTGGYCELRGEEVRRWLPGSPWRAERHSAYEGIGTDEGIVLKDRFGCVWMRGTYQVSYQCPGDPGSARLPSQLASAGTPELWQLPDGTMAIPSTGEFTLGRPGHWRVFTPRNGYPSDAFSLVTKDGSILLSNARGLFAFPTHLKMEFWTERDGLNGCTWSVARQGEKMFAIAGDAVYGLAADRSRWLPLAGIAGAAHLTAGPGNTLFVSSRSEGIVQINPDGRILRRSEAAHVTMLARDADGQVWSTAREISKIRLKGQQLQIDSEGNMDGVADGIDMNLDRHAGLWVCSTAAGLIHMDHSAWHSLSTKNGLLANSCRSLAIDSSGDIWYGYDGTPGFSWIRNPAGQEPSIRHFIGGDATGTAASNFFHSDRRGWLWRGTEDGVYVADLEQARQGRWLYLNQDDGLPGADTNRRSSFEDADGSVWFGMGNSVAHLTPADELVHPAYAPSAFISGFSWPGEGFHMADTVERIGNGKDVTAYIGSLQFDRRNALRVRYRVLPEQQSWSETKNLNLELGRLRSGAHTLEVQGRLFAGPWSGTASRSFRVLRPVWATEPYLLLYALAAMGLATASMWLRGRRGQYERRLLPDLRGWRQEALSPELYELAGERLDGRYEMGEVLARGAFASVVAARDLREARYCAIKMFHNDLRQTKANLELGFEREVAALRQIRHENVVSIYANGRTEAGAPYFVMEFVEGTTLRKLLQGGPLPRVRAGRLLKQLAEALDAIHHCGIYHRDVKPENVMVRHVAGGDAEKAVLIDFSIAIIKDADETLHALSRAAGTFHYMAPEQAMGDARAASDVFSLAKVAIEMMTGTSVATLAPNVGVELAMRVPEILGRFNLGLSQESVTMLARALQFDPLMRPTVASEFARPIVRDLG